jgi:glycerate kinase
MRILVASNPHKGLLSSLQVGNAIREGLRTDDDTLHVDVIPIADGGDGTIECMQHFFQGHSVLISVPDLYENPVEARAFFCSLDGRKSVFVETADIVGAKLVHPPTAAPLKASSFGVGEFVKRLLHEYGEAFEDLYFGLGGSAVSDAGLGMAQSLGYSFSRKEEAMSPTERHLCCLDLNAITSFSPPEAPPFSSKRFFVLSDVSIPLCGKTGQANTFGHQKGFTHKQIGEYEQGLQNLSLLAHQIAGKEINKQYFGAAGGLAAGISLFLEGSVLPGCEALCNYIDISTLMRKYDYLITGEGKTDSSTLFMKAPTVLGHIAHKVGVQPFIATGMSQFEELSGTKVFAAQREESSHLNPTKALTQMTMVGVEISKFIKGQQEE